MPTATAQGVPGFFSEDFEDSGFVPVGDYTYTSGSANALISGVESQAGNKSFQFEGLTSTNFASFEVGEMCGAGSSFNFWLYMDAYPDVGDSVVVGVFNGQPGIPGHWAALSIASTGAVSLALRFGASAAFEDTGATMPLSTWIDFSVNAICNATGTEPDGALGSNLLGVYVQDSFSTAIEFTTMTKLAIYDTGPDGGAKYYLDSMSWEIPEDGLESAALFCAAPDEEIYGYDYLDDVVYEDPVQATAISYDDAFRFVGDSSSSDKVAKGLSTGSTALMVRFRIEADTEFHSSKFRVAFTTGATTLTEGSAQDSSPGGTDFLASGDNNGEDGGNFDENIQVHFVEDDDVWSLRAYYNTGAGIVQLPGAVNFGSNPNSPTTFQVVVNSGAGDDIPASVGNHTIPSLGDEVIGIQNGNGDHIFSWGLPAALSGAVWKDQWFIGQGTSAFDAYTYIDDLEQQENHDSTCLWDLIGTAAVVGSSGTIPGSQIIDGDDDDDGASTCGSIYCVDSASVPAGFTVAAFNGMMGLVLVGMMTIGGVGAMQSVSPGFRVGGLVVGIFAVIGYLMALFFGLLPIWPIIAVVIIAGAALAFKFWKAGG